MAYADYYLCDLCECKTFYDSNLDFDDDLQNPGTGHPWPNGNVGWMVVLCRDCASTHKVIVTPKPPNNSSAANPHDDQRRVRKDTQGPGEPSRPAPNGDK